MKMTMLNRDVKAIENGMKKFNTDERGLLQIVNGWIDNNKQDEGKPRFEDLLHFKSCIELYIQWHE
ncbi:hypothetical protein TROLL_276 [Bacillus phage Troll]|uniref:Uncharacterized protein n=1 Tax=Bacillus phage Troll TaxID=1382932 RepID=S5YQ59_9CAUD|nr:hypothetical protein TROLL_276 [Bacillus phage Troll]AGT13623.1 hypothetical protein TROLL_276 [Bacillus phage Troll]